MLFENVSKNSYFDFLLFLTNYAEKLNAQDIDTNTAMFSCVDYEENIEL